MPYQGRTKRARALAVGRAPARANRRARAIRAAFTPRMTPRPYPVKGAIAPYGGRQELKYVDLNQAGYPCDTTGSVTALNLIAVGDDNTNRDGRQVNIVSVQGRGIFVPVDNGTSPSLARVLLVWDNANNGGALPTIGTIMNQLNGTAFPLIDNANRFTILSDTTCAIGAMSNAATQAYAQSPTVAEYNIYKRLNQTTQFVGTTASIGSIQNGSLLLVTLGTQAAGDGPLLTASWRVRFTDL